MDACATALAQSSRAKNGLEIWRIGSFPQNLAWIHAALSGLTRVNGRMTDAYATTVAPRTKSSRAKKRPATVLVTHVGRLCLKIAYMYVRLYVACNIDLW